jgi:hypothetical protein
MDIGIVGTWISDLSDLVTKNNIGNVTMTFTNDGRLIYDVQEGKKLQRMYMTYRINGDIIISDQQSNPNEQKTKFKFVGEDQLVLEFDGIKTVFKRNATEE